MIKKDAIRPMIKRVTDKMPTLPNIYTRVRDMIEDPRTSTLKVAEVISEDPVLSARVLKLVNSAFYGFPSKITTISRAIGIIGFNELKQIVFTTSIFDIFKIENRRVSFDVFEFWKHSFGCGIASKAIATRIGEKHSEEFLIFGLLHDLGKLIMLQFDSYNFSRVLALSATENKFMIEAEKEILGFDHCDLAGETLKKWNLPEKTIMAIANHHCPADAGQFVTEASVVNMANVLIKAMMIGNGGSDLIPYVCQETWNKLGFNIGDIELMMNDVYRESESLLSLLEVARV
jgi:HD-like signal output (HDOD) protein